MADSTEDSSDHQIEMEDGETADRDQQENVEEGSEHGETGTDEEIRKAVSVETEVRDEFVGSNLDFNNEATNPDQREHLEGSENGEVETDHDNSSNKDNSSLLQNDTSDNAEQEQGVNVSEDYAEGSENEEERKEDGSIKQEEVSKLMQNIFGDDDVSDDDDDQEGPSERKTEFDDEDEPKLIRVEQDEEEGEEDSHGRRWDFDVMLGKKKDRKRRRRKDGSIDLMADADDQIRALVEAMKEAANDDRASNNDRRPAVKKRKMLPIVTNTLIKADLFEAMLDNDMIIALSEWLAPLPDKSLPALEIRCKLLKILEGWPNLEQGILKQSGLGRAVMYLYKHPKETRENKLIAAKLIREWSRPIFQLDSDFRSLSKEERVQRDYSQMPLAKKRRLSMENDDGIFSAANKQRKQSKQEEGKRPGEQGFVPRARVPKPSTRDYVIRPKPEIESHFRGETKSKQTSRFTKVQREIRNQKNTKRVIGVSINKAVV